MKLLLDTHVLLWWLADDPRLRPAARAAIADKANHVYVSVVSLWEISIKRRIDKLHLSGADVAAVIGDQGIEPVPIAIDHLAAVEALPRHHGDPFDHLILAQAQCLDAVVITGDTMMARYGVRCLPA